MTEGKNDSENKPGEAPRPSGNSLLESTQIHANKIFETQLRELREKRKNLVSHAKDN
jgi:hypothetical protein